MFEHDVEFIITTFKRYPCLERLLNSIDERYPKQRIWVGDQNKPPRIVHKRQNRVLNLPYDCGLSYARNKLVEATTAPFVLLLEDDFEFVPATLPEKLLLLMNEMPNVGVVGGAVRQNNVPIPFEFYPMIEDGVLYHRRDGDNWLDYAGLKFKSTGACMNFALFRREMFEDVQWDPQLKLREHQDFYIRLLQTKWRVLFTPDVWINDAKEKRSPQEYQDLKNRDEFLVTMMKKHDLHKIKYQNGSTRELIDGAIVYGKEPPIL